MCKLANISWCVVLAMVIKLGFIILGAFGVANMWEAVFADVGVALLAILNATRIRTYLAPQTGNVSEKKIINVLSGSSAK